MNSGEFQTHRNGSTQASDAWWRRFRLLEIPLPAPWSRWFLAIAVLAGVAPWARTIVRVAEASILGDSVEATRLDRAVALEPDDPELQHRLGMVLGNSLSETDRSEGLQHLRRATELAPIAARYWSDYGWACELAGDNAGALRAVAQAVQLSPCTPHLRWVAANAFLRLGERDAATEQFSALLKLDHSYGPATFHVCLGALQDAQLIADKVIPTEKDPALKLAYASFLSANGLHDTARRVWKSAMESGGKFPAAIALPYVDGLLQLGRADEARDTWRDLENSGVVAKPASEDESNLVYNGDFEQAPLNAGLDWRSRPGEYVVIDFADPDAHTGKMCARLEFTVGQNNDFLPFFQLVPVSPGHAYVLSAFVRSQDITSDSGPRLQVLDARQAAALNVSSETTVGTTPWHEVRLPFVTGPQTDLLQIAVARPRGRSFPMDITGTFWIDTIVLKSVGPAKLGAELKPDR